MHGGVSGAPGKVIGSGLGGVGSVAEKHAGISQSVTSVPLGEGRSGARMRTRLWQGVAGGLARGEGRGEGEVGIRPKTAAQLAGGVVFRGEPGRGVTHMSTLRRR